MPYEHFPKVIQRAILLVESHPCLNVLTDATRAILKAIVTRVDKNDGCATLYAQSRRLAEESGFSTKSVQRAVQSLEKLALIERVGDGRDDKGSFTYLHLALMPTLAKMLNLPLKKAHETTMSDGLYIDLNLKDHLEDSQEKSEQQKPVELPPELEALPEQLGIKPSGIAKLRGLAYKAGHKLEHVATCAKVQIQKLGIAGHRAYRYLESLIAKPDDYASRADQAGRVAAQIENEVQAKARTAQHAGKRFVGSGGVVYRFMSDGRVELLDGGTMLGYAKVDQITTLLAEIEAGEVKPLTDGVRATIPAAPLPPAPPGARMKLADMLKNMRMNDAIAEQLAAG